MLPFIDHYTFVDNQVRDACRIRIRIFDSALSLMIYGLKILMAAAMFGSRRPLK